MDPGAAIIVDQRNDQALQRLNSHEGNSPHLNITWRAKVRKDSLSILTFTTIAYTVKTEMGVAGEHLHNNLVASVNCYHHKYKSVILPSDLVDL